MGQSIAPRIVRPESVQPDRAQLHGTWLTLAHAVWLTLAFSSVALFIVSLPPYYRQVRAFQGVHQFAPEAVRVGLEQLGIPLTLYAALGIVLTVLQVALFAGIGAVIYWRKSDDPMMLFVSATLVVFGAIWPNTMDDLASAHPLLALPELSLNAVGFAAFFLLFYLFPDGRFVPRWTRWIAAIWVAFEALTVVLPNDFPDLGPAGPVVMAGLLILFPGTMLYAQIHRYRRESIQTQRQQIKWVTFALVATLITFVITGLVGTLPYFNRPAPAAFYQLTSSFVYGIGFTLVPVAIGLAVLRHRLWDIDPIINHTLVYGALTVSVVGLYVLVVGELGVIFQTQGNLLFSLVAAGLTAVVFQPLRLRLQRGVNRLMYGRRDDPYSVLAGLDQRLEATLAPETVLPTVVEMVSEALKLPYTAITLGESDDASPVAEVGSPGSDVVRLPLVYQHAAVGELWLAARAPGEPFNQFDQRLLDDLARRAAAAAYAVRLTAELQHSRERLVTAREEERRRIRRDLHDGLGPRLAGLIMRLETARDRLGHDPLADELLADLALRLHEAMTDIRRLVYALRPPALDELGLISALREVAAQSGMPLTVDAPNRLPLLPAAVEVAAYRIGQEALTNVVRHAQAKNCRLRLTLADEGLDLEVWDDGVGLAADRRAGVGLSSMRERAEELGGRLAIMSEPGATSVRVVLPCQWHSPESRETASMRWDGD